MCCHPSPTPFLSQSDLERKREGARDRLTGGKQTDFILHYFSRHIWLDYLRTFFFLPNLNYKLFRGEIPQNFQFSQELWRLCFVPPPSGSDCPLLSLEASPGLLPPSPPTSSAAVVVAVVMSVAAALALKIASAELISRLGVAMNLCGWSLAASYCSSRMAITID